MDVSFEDYIHKCTNIHVHIQIHINTNIHIHNTHTYAYTNAYSGAILDECQLRGTQLYKVNLQGASLFRSDVVHARGLSPYDIEILREQPVLVNIFLLLVKKKEKSLPTALRTQTTGSKETRNKYICYIHAH
jgi:hypothetical protein